MKPEWKPKLHYWSINACTVIWNGITFLPNDRYLLENDKFRLYYTSECEEAQNFIVVIEDNFGNVFEMEFDLNNNIGS